jgi:CBS domain-containing protein
VVDEWFTRAAGGTLFIDCVGHLGTNAQARLSARLDEQSRHVNGVTPLNGEDCVRVITGNHRSLHENLAVGAFDDTLFYRLNVIHINRMRGDEAGEHCMKARDVMSQPPYICGPDTDLASVAKIMWDHDCGFVPVVDASGTVAGAVTDRDICIATSTRRLLPEQISAAQVMTSPIHACLPDDEISDVLATMKQSQIRRLPVIGADGRLRGVISLNDLVLASTDKREPRAADVIATIAAIGAHRRTAALA